MVNGVANTYEPSVKMQQFPKKGSSLLDFFRNYFGPNDVTI
jgi:hypothetical protein